MKIINNTIKNPYNTNIKDYDNKYQPSFGSMGFTFGTYRDCFGINRETQNTTGKRGDISLEHFAQIIKLRFKDFDKVNIMLLNVSDGTEGYFLANALIRNEGLDTFTKKYSPIQASDVMPNVINNYAKNGLLHLYNNEISEFDKIGMDVLKEVDIKDYQDKIIPQIDYPDKLFKLSDEYRKHFNFQVEDLQSKIIDLKDKGNSIIAIRNCLRQSFGETQASMILLKLFMKMKGASLLLTGDYDRKSQLINETLQDHFFEIKHNIWGLKDYGYIKNYLTKLIK